MAWMTAEIRTEIEEVEIGVNDWADHNPIIIKWKGKKQFKIWTINQSICRDKEYRQMLEKELTLFFTVNKRKTLQHKTYGIL